MGETISVGNALAYSALGFCIVFVGLVFLMIVIWVMSKVMHTGNKPAPVAVAAPAAPAAPRQLAPGSAGELKLYNVPAKEAAMIMAIVANQLQKPLNELRFQSIKEVK